jgi:Uma2 family endonuclease
MEQRIPTASRRFTEEEYLSMEEAAPTKHEFRNGEIIDMAGGSYWRGVIAANMIGRLLLRLDGKPCRPVGGDVSVRIPLRGHYCYPDVTIVCGQPVFDPPDRERTISNPQIIMEVSSPSTESADRKVKFSDYRTLQSLEEYFLVSQEKPEIESFYRQPDGIWAIGPTFSGMDQMMKFRSLGIEIPLPEVYAGVEFPKIEPLMPPAESR